MVFFEFLNTLPLWEAILYMLFVLYSASLTFNFIIVLLKVILNKGKIKEDDVEDGIE
jgi:hypothetical protein